MQISRNDLLDALRAATTPKEGDEGEGFRTVKELVQAMGCAEDKVRKALKVVHADGRLEVQQVRRPMIDGRIGYVPAYRMRAA